MRLLGSSLKIRLGRVGVVISFCFSYLCLLKGACHFVVMAVVLSCNNAAVALFYVLWAVYMIVHSGARSTRYRSFLTHRLLLEDLSQLLW